MINRSRMLPHVPMLIGLLLLCLPGTTAAQTCYFEREWRPGLSVGDYSMGLDVVEVYDGLTVLMVASPNTFTPPGISLVHTNACGQPQWSMYYCGLSDGPPYGRLTATSDGGYLIYAIIPDSAGLYTDAALIKTDSAGMLQWNRRYGGLYDEAGGGVIETSDGGYLLCLSVTDSVYQPYGYPLVLIKLDSAGQAEWSYEYYDLLPTKPQWQDLIECPEGEGGGYLLVDRNILLRIDPLGNALWSKLYSGVQMKRVFKSGNGYLVAGNSVQTQSASLVKISNSGQLLWHKIYPTNSNALNATIIDGMKTQDGGLALVGTGLNTSSMYPDRGVLLKVDSTGGMQWYKAYQGTYTGHFNAVAQTTDGKFVMTGFTMDASGSTPSTYFVRADFVGQSHCQESDAGLTQSVYVIAGLNILMQRVPEGRSNPFLLTPSPFTFFDTTKCFTIGMDEPAPVSGPRIFPNPSNGTFTIERLGTAESEATIALYDVHGRVVREEKYVFAPGQTQCTFTFDVAAGMYLLRMVSDEESGSARVVVK